jgi:hypothetical protein
MFWYKIRHAIFKWVEDEEGDLALVVCGFLVLLKYKEHTIVRFDGQSSRYRAAAKYYTKA